MNFCADDLRLYAVTDRHWLCGKSLGSQVELALKGGATMIQLREKNMDGAVLYDEALMIQSLCRKFRVPFIINDDVALAVRLGADGAHVGQDDMDAGKARSLLGADKILGVSAQTVEAAIAAEAAGADYLGVGAIFPTSSKDADVLAPGTLEAICRAVRIPVVAIGGITAENLAPLAKTGAAGISVISAIFAQDDILSATKNLRRLVEESRFGAALR